METAATENQNTKKARVYSRGTLTYTPMQLVKLFICLLVGGFSITFINYVQGGGLFTLSLNAFNTSPVIMGIVLGSIPAGLNMILCPIISYRSDRSCSKLGRRKPYILMSGPIMAVAIAAIGWAPYIVNPVADMFNLAPDTVGKILIGTLVVIYSFFNMFVGSVFYYLYADVVPLEFIGRFNAFFTLVGSATGIVFSFAVSHFINDYMPWIYTAAALIFFLGMMGVCLWVKEEVQQKPEESLTPLQAAKNYLKECFASDKIYWWFFTATAANEVSVLCRGLFNVLFATEELQISKDVYFKIGGYIGPFILLLYFIMGFLVDYFRAIRVYFAGMILVIAANIYGYFFCNGLTSYIVVAVALSVVYCIQNSSTMPLFVDILPKDRYGQFCSAQALFRSVLMFICNAIAGTTVALFGYRFIFVWDALFTIFALFATFMMARRWSQLGGIKSYIAP